MSRRAKNNKFHVAELFLGVIGFLGFILSLIDNTVVKAFWERIIPEGQYFVQEPLGLSQALLLTVISSMAMFIAYERKGLFEVIGDVELLNSFLSFPQNIREKLETDGRHYKEFLAISSKNQKFKEIAEDILKEQNYVLHALSEGKIYVPLSAGVE